jgi:molybdenum cofactor cytidylyltransferase
MGRPKQLLPAGNVSLLDRIIGEALHSELDHVVLVLGHQAHELRAALVMDLNHPKLHVRINKDYRSGISTSLLTGLKEVEKTCDHIMVLLADMPYITTDLINLLLRKYLVSGLPLGAIRMGGNRSHPVIIARSLFPALHEMQGDTGARSLFLEHRDQVCLVTPPESYRDIDVDTPEDYKQFIETLKREESNG